MEAQSIGAIAQLERLNAGPQDRWTVRSHAALFAHLNQEVYGGAVLGRSNEREGCLLYIRRRIARCTTGQ